MKYPLLLLGIIFGIAPLARGADEVKLEPNARWHLYFPELPDTLATMVTGEKHPPQLTVRLPANYSVTGKFPLFLFLNGGDGGIGDRLPLDNKTIGTNDFICVNLPLFKRSYLADTNDNSKVVVMEDYDRLSGAYRVMLQKLFDTVPNVTRERSALGGFSNGAHTIGILMERHDEFILQHFQSFYLVEGGFGSLAASLAVPVIAPGLEQSRVLVLYGDKFSPKYAALPVIHDHLVHACDMYANQNHFDFTSVVMHGYGHELPPKYCELLAKWIRSEKLPEVGKK
jgi:predicted esterase